MTLLSVRGISKRFGGLQAATALIVVVETGWEMRDDIPAIQEAVRQLVGGLPSGSQLAIVSYGENVERTSTSTVRPPGFSVRHAHRCFSLIPTAERRAAHAATQGPRRGHYFRILSRVNAKGGNVAKGRVGRAWPTSTSTS